MSMKTLVHSSMLRGVDIVVSLAAVLFCFACSGSNEQFLVPRKPVPLTVKPVRISGDVPTGENLLWIVIDTLRADRLGCYGYRRNTTPEIDRIAAEGIRFERFYAASPWTAPSFGTMFTGVSPAVHKTGRMVREKPAAGGKQSKKGLRPINANIRTVAELLEKRDSAGFFTNLYLQESLGFHRGFDHFDVERGTLLGARRADKVVSAALKWLGKKRQRPFMTVVHFMDPHTAYDPLPKYRRLFLKGDAPTEFVKAPFAPKGRVMRRGYSPSAAERRYIMGLYNGELRHVDTHIGRLIRTMATRGMLDKTWVIITADHGEEHYDHGGFNHGYQFEDEVTRVPLIIRAPGAWGGGTLVDTAARHVDLLPTVLEWFDIPAPRYLEGKSLMPILRGEETRHRPAYMEFPIVKEDAYAYFDGRYKLIKNVTSKLRYMYDLHTDPLERHKLHTPHKRLDAVEAEMAAYRTARKGLIDAVDKGKMQTKAARLSDEEQRILENLGYIE